MFLPLHINSVSHHRVATIRVDSDIGPVELHVFQIRQYVAFAISALSSRNASLMFPDGARRTVTAGETDIRGDRTRVR